MSKLEKFHLFSAIVGLIVNAITIIGLLLGFFSAESDASFLLSRATITIITAVLLFYSIFGIGYYLLQALRRRWLKKNALPHVFREIKAFSILLTMLWIPFFWLWLLGVYDLWESQMATDSKSAKDFFEITLFIGGLGGVLPPVVIQHIIYSVDSIINPDWNR